MLPLNENAHHFTDRDGVNHRYYRQQSSHTHVGLFLHGYRSCALGGEKSNHLLANARQHGWDWVRFDLPCHGENSAQSFDRFSLEHSLRLTEDLITHLGKPAVLVGSSMGGWLAALLAQRHTRAIHGLVLIAPAFHFILNYYQTLPEAEKNVWRKHRSHQFTDAYSGEGYPLGFHIIEEALRLKQELQTTHWSCPCTLIHGSEDAIIPLQSSQTFIQKNPQLTIQFRRIEGGDHRLNDHVTDIAFELNRLMASL